MGDGLLFIRIKSTDFWLLNRETNMKLLIIAVLVGLRAICVVVVITFILQMLSIMIFGETLSSFVSPGTDNCPSITHIGD